MRTEEDTAICMPPDTRSGEHLLALIDDILDMSKIEAGCAQINPAAFGSAPLIPELFKELPAAFIGEMRTAILDGDKSHLDVLIQTIGERDVQSARAAQQLADNYEHDALIHLLEEAIR